MLLLLILSTINAHPFALQDATDSWGWGEKIWYYTDYVNDEEGTLLFSIAYSRDRESEAFVPKVKRRYRYAEVPVYTDEILSTWSQEDAGWIDIQKYESTYNERGDLILYEEASKTADAWIPSRKRVNDFDQNGNQLLRASYSWKWDDQIWVCDNYEAYTFTEQSQPSSHISYSWDASIEDVRPRFKSEQVYDENGLLIMDQSFNWDDSLGDWRSSSKTEYFNDDLGLLKHAKKSLWDGQTFVDHTWSSYAHNAEGIRYLQIDSSMSDLGIQDPVKKLESIIEAGHIINTTEFEWDEDLERWDPSWKDGFTFDENGRQLSEGRFHWSASDSAWNPFSKREYGYDEYGNLVLEIESEPDFNPPYEMVLNMKKVFAFDEYGNQTLLEIYRWDLKRDDWKGSAKYIWTYDEASRQLTFEEYVWDEEGWTWKGTRKTYSTFDSGGLLVLDESVIWEYNNSTGNMAELSGSRNLLVFPNPASHVLNMEFDPVLFQPGARIVIYSMQGTPQAEYMVESSQAGIDISMLESGSYLLVLQSGSKRVCRVFLKQ